MRSIYRKIYRSRGAGVRRALIESLEVRRLFVIDLTLTGGTLAIFEEVPGINNEFQLQNGDNNTVELTDTADIFTVSTALANAGFVQSSDLHTVFAPKAGISQINIDLFDGRDDINIANSTVPVTIQPRSAATEIVTLGDLNSNEGATGITQPVTVDGRNAALLTVDVDDHLDAGNSDPTITSTTVSDLAGAPITIMPASQGSSLTPVNFYEFRMGTGTSGVVLNQDAFDATAINYEVFGFGRGLTGVEHLNANSTLNVDGKSGGTEEVQLGYQGQISGILGQIFASGDTGSVSALVNDSQDAVAHTFRTISASGTMELTQDGISFLSISGAVTGLTWETGPAANTLNLDLSDSEATPGFSATVNSGGTNDTIVVTGLGSASTLDLIGGAGLDHVTITSDAQGTIGISNSTGTEAVSIDGSPNSTAELITITDTKITGPGTLTINLANVVSIAAVGGSGADDFTVTPSATIPITVDGGIAAGASLDLLSIVTTQATGVGLSLTTASPSDSGAYTFTNRQPVNFTRFGTLAPTFGDLTGTVYNEQSDSVVAGAAVTVDENNNGLADAGEPTATTDANGAFSLTGLPSGTFGILALATGLQNLSATSATIGVGALSTPVLIPVIPLATAGAPDLISTVVAVAGGKAGLIKPKVRVTIVNLGASMSSSAALQIVLVASSDKALDSNDPKLLTTTTPPVILKAQKARTFTFTGSVPASLTKGPYFVLASVDAANTVPEANEANNVGVSTKAINLAPPLVDLSGKFGKLPKAAGKAKILSIPFALENLGTVAASGTVDFDFVASTDKVLDSSDVSLGSGLAIAAHAAAGKAQNIKFKLSLGTLPAGSYFLIAKVNSTASVAESDTTNNVIFSTTEITVA